MLWKNLKISLNKKNEHRTNEEAKLCSWESVPCSRWGSWIFRWSLFGPSVRSRANRQSMTRVCPV